MTRVFTPESSTHDVIIIGGGPGGYVAAIRARQLGLKTALVEKEHLGGICLNWGCIPTKALLRSAEIFRNINHAEEFGITVKGVSIDFNKIIQRSRDVSSKLTQGVKHLMKKNKVDVLEGHGSFAGRPNHIKVVKKDGSSEQISAPHIMIATGARARTLPGLEPDGKLVWSYKEAMLPDSQPKSLLVIGSGAIGMEFASFYAALGSNVTVVEIQDRILPAEDEEISQLARKQFEAQGITILTNTQATLKKGKNDVTASLITHGKSKEEKYERVIVAVGVVGNTEGLNIECTKIKVTKNQIETNEWGETAEMGVYAIGDVAGAPWLAHKASHEAIIAIERIAGKNDIHPLKKEHIPGCTYTHPQVASVGLTEAKAKAAGYDVKVGRFPFMGNGKAIALGEAEGLIKTVFDAATGELLGAHLIGAEVTELIQGFAIGKTMEATEADFIHTIFPHPTLSEMMHESVLSAYGQALHI